LRARQSRCGDSSRCDGLSPLIRFLLALNPRPSTLNLPRYMPIILEHRSAAGDVDDDCIDARRVEGLAVLGHEVECRAFVPRVIMNGPATGLLAGHDNLAAVGLQHPSGCPVRLAKNYVAISKKFKTNSFGEFGLSQWEEINPQTTGAKTYLILKKRGQPLHFREIAEEINKAKFDKRPALPQTIHNELIKDPRFVLVGRGTYGLAESGFKPGAASEVIKRILREKGPLPREKVIDLVLQERFLKPNTVLLNLQNKKHFKKLADGRYRLS